jgi:probable rRNA maturation factor
MTNAIEAQEGPMPRQTESTATAALETAPWSSADADIAVRILDPVWRQLWPAGPRRARSAARSVLQSAMDPSIVRPGAELTIVLADNATVRRLNRQYRGIDKPTNVLSFDGTDDRRSLPRGASSILGDVVLARQTVAKEAGEQGKSVADHAVHLVVHGVLHLLGYDHQAAKEADLMESIENEVLGRLGVANPYVVRLRRRHPWRHA